VPYSTCVVERCVIQSEVRVEIIYFRPNFGIEGDFRFVTLPGIAIKNDFLFAREYNVM
jgi:hypothetical protein